MTIETKPESKKLSEGGDETSPHGSKLNLSAASSGKPLIATPIVFDTKQRDGKNETRKYSRGSKATQKLSLGISKAAYRTVNSFAAGLSTFSDESDKSSRKRRDGMVRDSLRNASKAFEDGLNELGKAPDEIARRISGKTVTRVFRAFSL